MKNFGRAIRLALCHRATVVGIFFCSLAVAVFWGANIGTVYPFVEVVFEGGSMHEWVDRQIKEAEDNTLEFNGRIAGLKQEAEAAEPDESRRIAQQIAVLETRVQAEQVALTQIRRVEPTIKRIFPTSPFQTLLYIVGFLIFATLGKNLFLALNMMLVARLGEMTTMKLRKQMFRHTLRMELQSFGDGHTSALMSRFTVDLGAISQAVGVLFGKTLREPLKMIACLIGAALISWQLLLVSLIVTPIAFFLVYQLSRSLKRANRRSMEEASRFYVRLAESFNGIHAVKAYTMERYERSRYHQTVKELYLKSMRITFYNALTRLNTELLGVCIICLAILAGGYLVLSQETSLFGIPMASRPLSVGRMLAFFAFLIGVSDPARKLADVFNQVQRGVAAADRLYPMLDREPRIIDPVNPKPVPRPVSQVVFDNVDFHYTPEVPVLRGVSLTVHAGETVALVGPNGCGKSTLANLLPRFYDPTGGCVRMDYTDLREMRIRELRKSIGVVTQHAVLFDMSIGENIRYGSPLAKQEEVIAAAKKAHAHDFIMEALEHGYDSEIGERGGRLSGGQRQRIALARAILRDPELLILDEATSQIDPESERLIHHALKQFIEGRTTIMVTHRSSTLTLADRIIVMDEGQIVDNGTHQELLERCALYRRLYQVGMKQSA